jgi:hypothetical protein
VGKKSLEPYAMNTKSHDILTCTFLTDIMCYGELGWVVAMADKSSYSFKEQLVAKCVGAQKIACRPNNG